MLTMMMRMINDDRDAVDGGYNDDKDEDGGRRAEDGGPRTEDGGPRTNDGGGTDGGRRRGNGGKTTKGRRPEYGWRGAEAGGQGVEEG